MGRPSLLINETHAQGFLAGLIFRCSAYHRLSFQVVPNKGLIPGRDRLPLLKNIASALAEVVAYQGVQSFSFGKLILGASLGLSVMVRLEHETCRDCLACKRFELLAILVVNDEALSILEGLTASSMHLVVVPATFVELTITRLKDPLPLSDAFFVFALVLVPAQIKGDT